jgi:D-alanyl-D-alanine carboxypeptidase
MRAVGVSDTATGAPMSVDDHTRISSVTNNVHSNRQCLNSSIKGRIGLSDPISLSSTVRCLVT